MVKVFNIKKIPASHEGGYNFAIEYLAKCPVYQILCPLPVEQAKVLLEVLPKDQLPVACTRYAQIRAPGAPGGSKDNDLR